MSWQIRSSPSLKASALVHRTSIKPAISFCRSIGNARSDPICKSTHNDGPSRMSLHAFADWKALPLRSRSVATSEFDATEPPDTLAAVPEHAVGLK